MNETFFKSYFILPRKITLDHIVLNYCLLDTICFYQCNRQFHHNYQLAWQKADCSKHYCTTEPMSWKKYIRIHCEKTLWSWPKWKNCCQPLLRKQNNVKRLQWTKAHKYWTIELRNKVLWSDESKFKIFRSNRTIYVRWKVRESAATPCITPTVEHGGGFVVVCGAFANFQVGDLHQVKGKLN